MSAQPAPKGEVRCEGVEVFYGQRQALHGISLDLEPGKITAIIGPSGCGKSTFLKALNRILEEETEVTVNGTITLDGEDIYRGNLPVVELRRRVGMVFQQPNLFPVNIFDTVAFGPRVHGMVNKTDLEEVVEQSLKMAALWEEVKDRLKSPATALSGGQQQRLCIARALGVSPQILLMDEPCAALDPTSTAMVEDTINALAGHLTILLVTHNMHQAARASHNTAFFLNGHLMEYGKTEDLFESPQKQETSDYICGHFG